MADDPVDLGLLDQLADRDPAILLDLVETYLEETATLTARLKAALAAGAAGDAERLAHACAGSSAQLGAVAVVPMFKRLETLARAGTIGDVAPVVAELDRELCRVEAAFRTHAGLPTRA